MKQGALVTYENSLLLFGIIFSLIKSDPILTAVQHHPSAGHSKSTGKT